MSTVPRLVTVRILLPLKLFVLMALFFYLPAVLMEVKQHHRGHYNPERTVVGVRRGVPLGLQQNREWTDQLTVQQGMMLLSSAARGHLLNHQVGNPLMRVAGLAQTVIPTSEQ